MTESMIPEELNQISGIIEALLFISEKPVSISQIRKVLPSVGKTDIERIIRFLKAKYEERKAGISIFEIAEGYQMLTNPDYASYIRDFFKTRHKERLSKPALECMAIIAYKQPVTRADVELIRGVNSDGVIAHLLNKELIKVVGRKDVAGRPYLYGTTKQFLEYFGLKSLDDLPRLEEFPALVRAKDGSEAEQLQKLVEDESVNVDGRDEKTGEEDFRDNKADMDKVIEKEEKICVKAEIGKDVSDQIDALGRDKSADILVQEKGEVSSIGSEKIEIRNNEKDRNVIISGEDIEAVQSGVKEVDDK